MDRIKEKMQTLRLEADDNAAKAEELKTKVKTLEQENLAKEQEITSLTHRNQVLEGEVEKLEGQLKDAKTTVAESAQAGQQSESLQRRLQVLEEEAEASDKTLKETIEKSEPITDVKAGHYERKVQALEQARDEWESKYEEMSKKHAELQKELQELEQVMGNI
ncbi:tropomyosin-2 [Lithohypha guttulata]|uniref:Tropomyosin-2 n=1 Tax=Lithohypha guttulata TaxID=1690604 RepID=A0AAN7YDZ3_9EURO|nr:tropomyosin-2 [Lithohypha guttulata]